jgi:hypothetical protein
METNMTQYLHRHCRGMIKTCPNNDEAFCDRCGNWVDESDILENTPMELANNCSILEQGGSKMTQSNDTFELTNCPDPQCYICTMDRGGYPSAAQIVDGRIKLNAYHQKKLANEMSVLLDWIGRVA